MIRPALFVCMFLFTLSIFAQEETNNYLNKEKQEGKAERVIGEYQLVFSVNKDWTVLHLDVTDRKGNPVAIDILEIEALVRPGNRRSPFKVILKSYPVKQEGGQITSHYAADLNFVDNFKNFKANTFVTIAGFRCVSEFHFARD